MCRNNAPLFSFHILFILINLSLIASRLVEFSHARNIDGSRNWAIMVARAAGRYSFKETFAARFLQLVCSSQVILSESFLNLTFLSHARNIDGSRNWAIMVARAAGHNSFKGTFAARFLQLVCSSQVILSEGFLNLIFLNHARNIDGSRNWAIMVARAAGHNSFKGTFAARFYSWFVH